MVDMNGILIILASCMILCISLDDAYGHGIGYETLPPQMLGDRQVAMEVSSTVDNSTGKKQIIFSLFDTDTGMTIRDVSYGIRTIKNSDVVFEGTYSASNGMLYVSLIPDSSRHIQVEEKKESGIFGFLIGKQDTVVEARGAVFAENGLYKFTIDVISAEGYGGKPVRFESGLSFPMTATYALNDRAGHEIRIVSYYDTIGMKSFDHGDRAVSFTMPFEWTLDNINQTFHVHEEIFIPKTLTSFQVSDYELVVNGHVLPDRVLTVDDYANEYRVVHILLYQQDLLDLYEKQQTQTGEMFFEFSAQSDDLLLADVTDNVQYRIEATTKPAQISNGQTVQFLFKIFDVFLQGKTVSVDYDFAVKSGSKMIYKTSGISTDDRNSWNEITFDIPADASDMITVLFENIGGNGFARSEIPIMLSSWQDARVNAVPDWVKNNAGWWCKKSITDDDFLNGIEYLVKEGVMKIGSQTQGGQNREVPDWVRSSSCWWADGSITDSDFISSIEYLVKNGIIMV